LIINLKQIATVLLFLFSILTLTSWSFADLMAQPQIKDSSLKIEILTQGLLEPTSMAFLNNNSILATEKGGAVRLFSASTNGSN
jgi:glucose/arabinose dehydrogenase